MCMMCLMLVPQQYYQRNKKLQNRFHHIKHFGYIFSLIQFKTVAIIQYIKLQLNLIFVNANNNNNNNNNNIKQIVIIQRAVLPQNVRTTNNFLTHIFDKNKQKQMQTLKIEEDNKNIQQYYKQLKVDFANMYIGGGSLTFGAVQQQIMFAIHPQLYVSMLLCEKMQDYQILAFYGFKKYFNVDGYGYHVSVTGFNQYKYQYEQINININSINNKSIHKINNKYKIQQKYRIAKQYIVGIDAINFGRSNQDQYSKQSIMRQLAKAYLGFSVCQNNKWVVSGNWGCGVFGGNVQLKIIIQWLAASLNGKQLRYCPFGSKNIVCDQKLLSSLAKSNINIVLQSLLKCSNKLSQLNNAKSYSLRSRETKNNITLYELLQKHFK